MAIGTFTIMGTLKLNAFFKVSLTSTTFTFILFFYYSSSLPSPYLFLVIFLSLLPHSTSLLSPFFLIFHPISVTFHLPSEPGLTSLDMLFLALYTPPPPASCLPSSSCCMLSPLQLILLMGNYMNAGSRNQQSYGFDLSYLTKLGSTKSADQKTTLIHFLAKTVEVKFPDVMDFSLELRNIEEASKCESIHRHTHK